MIVQLGQAQAGERRFHYERLKWVRIDEDKMRKWGWRASLAMTHRISRKKI